MTAEETDCQGKEISFFFSWFLNNGPWIFIFCWARKLCTWPWSRIYHFTSCMILGKSLNHSKFVSSSVNCGLCFLLHSGANWKSHSPDRKHCSRRKHNELILSWFIHGSFWLQIILYIQIHRSYKSIDGSVEVPILDVSLPSQRRRCVSQKSG